MYPSVVAAARLQFTSMLRELLPWTVLAAATWTSFLSAQEPSFVRRFDVPFLDPSVRLGALVLGGLVGVVAAESGEASWRSLRDRSRRPTRTMLGVWLGGVGFALATALGFVVCAVVSSVVFGRQMTSFSGLILDGVLLVLVAANVLALAPAVAWWVRGLAFRVVVWTLLAASSSGALGFCAPIPIPVLWTASSVFGVEFLVPVVSALLASLCVASMAFRWNINPTSR